jgi:L-ascorbate metabolism protein UlaG (beta-lactamase superfamily)
MKQNEFRKVVRLAPGVQLEPLYRGQMLDCRLHLLGDRQRQLLRAYSEVIHRLSRNSEPASAAADVLDSAEIAQYYDVSVSDGCVKLTLGDAAFQEQYPLRLDDFALRVTAGSRAVTLPLPMYRFHAIGTLLPLLAGNYGDSDVLAQLERTLGAEEQEWSRGLLATLDAQRCLQRGPIRPNSFLASSVRPRVTFVGHTSVLLQTAASAILTDPLLRTAYSPAKAFDVARLDLNAICCTHAHWDHFNVETLLRFDKRIPVIIPRVHHATAFNPPMEPVLRRLGFQDIRELDPWESLQLGDIEMILVPFHGEQDEPGAKIDHYTYVYRMPGLTLYGGVDAYRDTCADMHDVLQRVRNEYHPSVAFLPISRMWYSYKHGGVNGFCRYVDTALLNEEFQYTAGPEEAAEWVRVLDVSTVVPYATFTFSPLSMLDLTNENEFARVNEFATALNQKGLGATLLPLRPLDALDLSDLDGSAHAAKRRRLLCAWHRIGAQVSGLNRGLRRYAAYRYARRLLSGSGSSALSYHH